MIDRRQWADFFEEINVKYAFFSARDAQELQEARQALEGASLNSKSTPPPPSTEDEEEETAKEEGPHSKLESDEEDDEEEEEEDDEEGSSEEEIDTNSEADLPAIARKKADKIVVDQDPRTRVLSVLELESLFINSAPDLQRESPAHSPSLTFTS